jgi:hypothetical protein
MGQAKNAPELERRGVPERRTFQMIVATKAMTYGSGKRRLRQ